MNRLYKMSKTIIENLYEKSDKLIVDWMSSDFQNTDTYKNDPFLSIQKKPDGGLLKPEYIELMPEPFFGDPENNLAVILNLNPGYGPDNKKHIGKNEVKDKLSQGYSTFAKTNPYLTQPDVNQKPFHPEAHKWWAKRYNWLKSILGYDKDDRKPFTLEFCPWHSNNWSDAGINIDDFINIHQDYIRDSILLPAAYAINNNRSVSPCIISIGKTYTKLYKSLGFTIEKTWQRPEIVKGVWPGKEVFFEYYKKIEINNQTIKALAIWLNGSNKTPSEEFIDIEKDIIEYIKTH